MTDNEIISMYHNRNEKAIDETEKKYGKYLAKIAHNVLGNYEESKQCVNDTYMRAWESMPPHFPSVLPAFLAAITRGLSIDVYRKNNAEKRKGSQFALSVEELAECVSGSDSAQDLSELNELSAAISQFLWEQSENTRNAFVARYFFSDSIRDTAKMCKVSESSMKTLLFRTRKALKDYLNERGYDV